MQDLENNNCIILDPLENIYEIYADLTVMTFLNLNHFWITTQAELCLKGTFVKVSFMFVTIIDIYENPEEKTLLPLPVLTFPVRSILKCLGHSYLILRSA